MFEEGKTELHAEDATFVYLSGIPWHANISRPKAF